MNKITAIISGAALPALLLFAACGSSNEDAKPAPQTQHEISPDGLPIAHIDVRYATALAADLDTLVGAMDVSFVGEVVSKGDQREMEMGTSGHGLPISVFNVMVISSNGEPAAGSTVNVEQLGGVTRASSGEDVHVVAERDTPIEVGQRYLFIASQNDNGAFNATAFARFPIENGRVTAPTGWEDTGATLALAGETVAEAMDKVNSSGR